MVWFGGTSMIICKRYLFAIRSSQTMNKYFRSCKLRQNYTPLLTFIKFRKKEVISKCVQLMLLGFSIEPTLSDLAVVNVYICSSFFSVIYNPKQTTEKEPGVKCFKGTNFRP